MKTKKEKEEEFLQWLNKIIEGFEKDLLVYKSKRFKKLIKQYEDRIYCLKIVKNTFNEIVLEEK